MNWKHDKGIARGPIKALSLHFPRGAEDIRGKFRIVPLSPEI